MNARKIIDNSLRRRTPNIRAMRALIPALLGRSGPDAAEDARAELQLLAPNEPRILALIPRLAGTAGPEDAEAAVDDLIAVIGGSSQRR